jgi:hypothetical protein
LLYLYQSSLPRYGAFGWGGDYRNFEQVVEKARLACFNSGLRVDDHFVDITEMVGIGKGGQRSVKTTLMSRYATIEELAGTIPEKLPVAESIKQIEPKSEKAAKVDAADRFGDVPEPVPAKALSENPRRPRRRRWLWPLGATAKAGSVDPLSRGNDADEAILSRLRWVEFGPPALLSPLDGSTEPDVVATPRSRIESGPSWASRVFGQSRIRQSAIMAAAAKDARLKKRTLTNLYNERPTWLKLAHETLDRAVLAAYAAVDPEGHWSGDWYAVWLDTGAGQKSPADHPIAAERARVDQAVLGNLLRMNQARAGKTTSETG